MKTLTVCVLLLSIAGLGSSQYVLSGQFHLIPDMGASSRMVVRGPTGLLHALVWQHGQWGTQSFVTVLTSTDGGGSWTAAPTPLNAPGTGVIAIPGSMVYPENWTAVAIDSQGLLHCTWGSNYPSSWGAGGGTGVSSGVYTQHYCSFDPVTNIRSPILDVGGFTGAGISTFNLAQEIIVDQNDTVWLVSAGASGRGSEHLLRSAVPQAAGQAFIDLGPIDGTGGARTTRLAVDSMGRIHASYFRTSGYGEYYHKIFDPSAVSWGAEYRLGNSNPGQDNFGSLAADNYGNVHAIYAVDTDNFLGSWGIRYRRYDPSGGWGSEVNLSDILMASNAGLEHFRMFSLACDETTGLAHVVIWDIMNSGNALHLTKELSENAFSLRSTANVVWVWWWYGPPSYGFIFPSIRGSLFPAFNNTGSQVQMVHCGREVDFWTYEERWIWRFRSFSAIPQGASLNLASPLTVGSVSTLEISSPMDPSATYFCGFAASPSPASPVQGGGIIHLADDFLLRHSLMQNNGLFFNNVGTLGPIGSASIAIAVPNDPSLMNLTIYSAFVTVDPVAPGAVRSISATLPMTIQ